MELADFGIKLVHVIFSLGVFLYRHPLQDIKEIIHYDTEEFPSI